MDEEHRGLACLRWGVVVVVVDTTGGLHVLEMGQKGRCRIVTKLVPSR